MIERSYICSFLASLSLLFVSCTGREQQLAEKPILKINQRQIDAKEFAERLSRSLRDYDALYAKDETNLKRAKERCVQTFVLETLTDDFAKKQGLSVSDQDVEREVQKIRSKYPDDLAFRRSLAQENLNFDEWKKSLRFPLLQQLIYKKITADAPALTEAQERAFYDKNKSKWVRPARVHLRQIVLAKEEDAQRIYENLGHGDNMARLAKQFSVGPEGNKGGDLGWIEKGTLDVFDQAFKLPVGAKSHILKSPYGYHILEVLGKEPETHLNFADVKDKIVVQMQEEQGQKAFADWLESEVRKARVYRNDALLDAIQVTTRGN